MVRFVVCGATGFIGRNVIERLAGRDGIDLVAVYNRRPPYDVPGVSWVQADLTRADDVERVVSGADVIIQAAATTSGSKDIVTRPYIHTADNAVMNSLLYRACYDHNVGHLVFFSCSVMYQSSDTPVREDDFDPSQDMHPRYFAAGWTKIYLEKMCEFYAGLGRTKFTVLRHSNIYGPYDKFDLERSHMFGANMTKILSSEDGGEIAVWGTGEEERDLLYVDDLVDCIELAIEKQREPYELFNVGAGHAVPVIDVIRKIIEHSGLAVEMRHDLSQPTIKTGLALDCSKIMGMLGWQSKTDLDDGIRRTIAWWRDNITPVQ